MSLSKIYRGAEADGLREFQFRSFGDPEPGPSREKDGFVKGAAIGQAAPAVASAAPKPGHSARDVEDAYARGLQEGLQSAEERLETTTQALAGAAEQVSRLRESLARHSRQDMLRLVMAVSEQVIRREAAVDPKVVLSIIENALQSSVRADHYRIRINPADLDSVTQQKPLFLASISGLKNLIIEADPAISPGGCRVDSDLGNVDATIETPLESIRLALNEAITDV
ncbi:MAG: flagellar assembly protein FliH [Desulfofustis sp.]|nr:flagellar assembly protein FliH [Desulfofustis sp.]